MTQIPNQVPEDLGFLPPELLNRRNRIQINAINIVKSGRIVFSETFLRENQLEEFGSVQVLYSPSLNLLGLQFNNDHKGMRMYAVNIRSRYNNKYADGKRFFEWAGLKPESYIGSRSF